MDISILKQLWSLVKKNMNKQQNNIKPLSAGNLCQ